MLPSTWANLMTSACWASTARVTISCWPLRAVPGCAGGLALAGAACGGRRREQRAEHLHALEEQLDARAVEAGDDRERVVLRRCAVMTGNWSAGEADDHVHVVAGLDDRADARDLVDLDRDGALALRHFDVDDLALRGLAEGVGRQLRVGDDRRRTVLPRTCEGSPKAPPLRLAGGRSDGRHLVGGDLGAERDVDSGDDGRLLERLRACFVLSSAWS